MILLFNTHVIKIVICGYLLSHNNYYVFGIRYAPFAPAGT